MVGVRRSGARSADSGFSSHSETMYTIEQWVAMKEPFRVVAYEDYDTVVKPLVPQILAQYNISSYSQNFDFLGPPHEESKAVGTLVVDTTNTNISSWNAAANAILVLFTACRASEIEWVQVEIRDSKLMYTDISTVLPDDQALIEALSSIQEQVFETVLACFGQACSSITYHMRVNRGDHLEANGKPTILVFCRPGSQCDFETGEDLLMRVLSKVPIQIHLEILAGEVCAG